MRGFLLFAAALIAASPVLQAQNDETENVERLDSAAVVATRAGRHTPITYTNVSRSELRASSPLNSLPMALGLLPSVVSVNEGGTGLGYSKMKIRGVSGSQTNVTLNGITLNDAESQEVFWVNIPALGSMLSSVQLQRGLGTTEAGAGAFGASLNMNTSADISAPSGSVELSGGSYNTLMTSVRASSGLTRHGFYADIFYSYDRTDGYIRNAKAKVNSLLATMGWMDARNSVKLTVLRGEQHSGITWEGIPFAIYESDRTYNPAGEYRDSEGQLRYYDNETDNYVQTHIQANYVRKFGQSLSWNTTLNYTRGDGYYEQYKSGKKGTKYGYEWKDKADFVIQKLMANDYYVLSSDLNYNDGRLNLTGGIYVSDYDGDHFGDVIWNSLDKDVSDHRWYFNNGRKKEFNAFLRAEYALTERLHLYGDVQGRFIDYTLDGKEDDGGPLDYTDTWRFFNPRAGVNYEFGKASRVYASVALGHREPGRSDLKNSIITAGYGGGEVRIKPESMLDFELGWNYSGATCSASANLYAMEYRDMLLETGKISDSGYAIKENVPRAWRRGIELAASWRPWQKWRFDWNTTLSVNQIDSYVAYVDNNDADWNPIGQIKEEHNRTDILLSPSMIAMVAVTYMPWKDWSFSVNGKYVGKQYWDNTSCEDRSIPAYNVWNCSISKLFHLGTTELDISAYVNNLLNRKYFADAWVYRAYVGGQPYREEGVFPQALRNAMLKLSFRF